MRLGGRVEHRLLVLDERHDVAVGVAFGDRARLDLELRDPPAVAVALEHEVDEAHVAAPEARHDARLAVDGPGLDIDAGPLGIVRAGEDPVRMTGEDYVDPCDAG